MNYKLLFVLSLVIIVGMLGMDFYSYKLENTLAEPIINNETGVCEPGEGCVVSSNRYQGFNVGNQMKNLTLTKFDGSTAKLYDLIGENKKFVLSFATDWCSDCQNQDAKMKKYYEQLPEGYDFAVVFVDYDSLSGEHTTDKEQARKYVEEEDYPFEVFWDEDAKLNNLFGGIKATPTNFVLDQGAIIKAKTEEIDADILMLPNKEDIYDKSLLENKSKK